MNGRALHRYQGDQICAFEKVAQNVAQNIFCQVKYLAYQNGEKS
jgi:hypothetical protein